MSGKYQHFLPRFLQEGFRANAKGRKTFWYHKARSTRLTSIGEVGAENYFYSRPSEYGEMTLDDIITNEEAILTMQMDKLRELPIGARVDANIASEMVAHFSVRTRNFREFFGTGGDKLVEEMSDAISDAWNVARLLGLDQPTPNDLWREFFEKRGDGQTIVDIMVQEMNAPKVWVERLVFMAARELIILNHGESVGGFLLSLQDMRLMLKKELPKFHSAALLESRKPQKRLDALTALHWQISAAPDEGAILPDCVVLGRIGAGEKFASYIMTSGTDVEVVVMPISSEKMLVGVQQGATLTSMAGFNIEAAANCAEFFVASVQTAQFEALVQEIGTAWSNEIDDLIDSSLAKYRPVQCPTPISASPFVDYDWPKEDNQTTDAAAEIAMLAKHYHQVCPKTCNFHWLERITVSADTNVALKEIDLGPNFDMSAEAWFEIMIPGVVLVSVRRGDDLKIIILIDASFFAALTSHETHQMELARSALLLCFSQVSAIARVEANLPGFMLAPVSYSDHNALIHSAFRRAIRAYWAGRDVAKTCNPDTIIQKVVNFATDALASSIDGINNAKKAHVETEDSESFLVSLLAEASNILAQIARLIGLQHGNNVVDEAVLPLDLAEALRPYGLETWAIIYGRDLRSLWAKDNINLSELYPMNIHVERLLLSFGVLIWQDEAKGLTRFRFDF
jgi:hypothetical protein